MDQLALPYRIALAAVAVIGVVWFVALRPKGASDEPATPTPAAQSAPDAATTSPPAAVAKTAAKPAEKAATRAVPTDPSQRILADLGKRHVAVVLFYNPLGADDGAVRRAVRAVDRFGGRVSVHTAPIAEVGEFERITQGVQVLQAPTLLVIGHDKRARRIVGLTDTKEIQQLVGDVGGSSFVKRVG